MDAGIRWRVWWIQFASRENEMQKGGKEIAFVIRYLESDNDIFTLHLEVNRYSCIWGISQKPIFSILWKNAAQRSEWQRDICFRDLIKSVVLNCKGAFSCHAFGKGLFILAGSRAEWWVTSLTNQVSHLVHSGEPWLVVTRIISESLLATQQLGTNQADAFLV